METDRSNPSPLREEMDGFGNPFRNPFELTVHAHAQRLEDQGRWMPFPFQGRYERRRDHFSKLGRGLNEFFAARIDDRLGSPFPSWLFAEVAEQIAELFSGQRLTISLAVKSSVGSILISRGPSFEKLNPL